MQIPVSAVAFRANNFERFNDVKYNSIDPYARTRSLYYQIRHAKVIEDQIREFIITFFCCDDSLQIFDVEKRNSGFMPGKFLERARYRN